MTTLITAALVIALVVLYALAGYITQRLMRDISKLGQGIAQLMGQHEVLQTSEAKALLRLQSSRSLRVFMGALWPYVAVRVYLQHDDVAHEARP